MEVIRIFISSPGDVSEERQISGKVLERLQGKFWSFVRLDEVFWERKVVRSTAHYQEELINPEDCQIVVGILWSRLGSPLPEKFLKESGERYSSGTEWELEMAFEAYGRSLARLGDAVAAKPDIVVYRRNQPRPRFEDVAKDAEAGAQEGRLNAYLKANYWFPDGTIKRPIAGYVSLDEFEAKLSTDLEQLILRHIPGLKSGYEPPPISGSPFKGLHSFDFEDSDRYFGRNREIREIQRRLSGSAGDGTAFILIYGGSGYGKSSLMRAGLAPVIVRPGGALPGINGWRRVSFQPAKGDGSLCERFVRQLLVSSSPEQAEKARLNEHWPLMGIAELADASSLGGAVWDTAALARHIGEDDLRGYAVEGIAQALESIDRHLLLEIDQLEEIFTTPSIDERQRAAFLQTLEELCMTGRVWVVATMRSEFFPRVAEQPELLRLVGKNRGYILPPPDHQSLREIIRYPALAARLDFEQRIEDIEIAGEKAKHAYLNDQILADAESSPDALPLLEFTLQRLYERRDGRLLTWAAYAEAGGLKGAIARRASEVYRRIPAEARASRHRIFAALVHVDPAHGTVTRRRAQLRLLGEDLGSEIFLRAFLEAHLLVTDEDLATDEPVVTLAHEALISHWDELSSWVGEHHGDLLARQRLGEHARLWQENGEKKSYLLAEARLAEAERVGGSGLFALGEGEISFLHHSRRRAKRKQKLLQGAVAMFAMIAAAACVMGWLANMRKNEAEANRREAENQRTQAETEKENAAELNRQASRKAYATARDAFQKRSDSRGGLAALAEALTYDPANRLAGEEAAHQLLMMGTSASPVPVLAPLLHGDPVADAAFSPDGSFIVSCSGDTARVWNAATGKPVGEPLGGEGAPVYEVSFSTDGKRVITVEEEGYVNVWDAATGKLIWKPSSFEDYHMGHSPDGLKVVTKNEDGVVRILDVTSGKRIGKPLEIKDASIACFSSDGSRILIVGDSSVAMWDASTGEPVGKKLEHQKSISIAYPDPEGSLVLTVHYDNQVRVWDVDSGEFISEPLAHASQIKSAKFSPDLSRIVTTHGSTVRVWDFRASRVTREIEHGPEIESASFSPDGLRVVTAGSDSMARVWSVDSGKLLTAPLVHDGLYEAEFSPDGAHVLTFGADKTVRVWESFSPKPAGVPLRHPYIVNSVSFNKVGTRIVTASSTGNTARIWDPATGLAEAEPLKHGKGLTSAIFSPDGDHLVTTGWDNVAQIWDASSGQPMGPSLKHGQPVYSAAFNGDGTLVVTAGEDKAARIWEVPSGKPVGKPLVHGKTVEGASFSKDGTQVIAFDEDSARIWDVKSGNLVKEIKPDGHVLAVSEGEHGIYAATMRWDKHARIWDVMTGKPVGEPLPHDDNVYDAVFGPDGSQLLTLSEDFTARLWDVSSGVAVGEPMRNNGHISSAAFSHDGARVVTSADQFAQIWDTGTAESIGDPFIHAELICSVAFSPDGSSLITTSIDCSARIWKIGADLAADVAVDLLKLASGYRIAEDGRTVAITFEEHQAILAGLKARRSESGDEVAMISWLTAEGPSRSLSPSSVISLRESATRDIVWMFDHPSEKNGIIFEDILKLDPRHPLLPLAGALVEKDGRRKEFLISYAASRLPEDRDVLEVAARFMGSLGAAEHALAITDRRIVLGGAAYSTLKVRVGALKKLKRIEEWTQACEVMLGHSAAEAGDFADSAYLASKVDHGDLARKWLKTANEKFPDEWSIRVMEGWTLVNLGDTTGAGVAFKRALATLDAGNSPGPILLAGLAISSWLNGETEDAIGHYTKLIAAGRAAPQPFDWTDAGKIAAIGMTEAELGPLDAVRIETLKRHPELVTPRNAR